MFSAELCTIPWHSIYIHPNGSVRPCCMQSTFYGDTAEGDRVESVWNSTSARQLRRAFLEGKTPATCISCTLKEKTYGKSRRTLFNAYMNQSFPEKMIGPLSEEAPLDIVFLDLSFSNRCNLKCRFCGPMNSSSWFADAKALRNLDAEFWDRFMSHDYQKVSQKAEYYIELIHRSPSLRRIEIKGGEPLLSQEQIPFLQELIRLNKAAEIELEYSTNGSVVLPALKELWPHFKAVSFCLSAEATGPLYQYLRGGNYSLRDVEKNLKFFDGFPHVKVDLHVTYSGYNLFALPELVDWFEKIKDSYSMLRRWQLGMVANPRPLYVGHLPEEIRAEALLKMAGRSGPPWDSARSSLQLQVSRDESLRHFQQFKKYVTDLDQVRGTRFLETVPEYEKFWSL